MPSPYRDQHDEFPAKYLAAGKKNGAGFGREVVGRRKDGSTFPMLLSVGEMRLGERRLFTGVLHDISDRKQAEERALQAERLAAIGQMIGVVTHESRNALQRMMVNLEMAAMELEDQPDALEFISRAQRAQDDLHHLPRREETRIMRPFLVQLSHELAVLIVETNTSAQGLLADPRPGKCLQL